MKKILALLTLLLLTLPLLTSGCTQTPPPSTEKKYTNIDNPSDYILLNSTDNTVFLHKGSVGNYTGTYNETNAGYTLFLSDGSTPVYYRPTKDSICMVQTEKKYVDPTDSNTYIEFNINDKTFAFVKYGISLIGKYEETDTDYTLVPDIQNFPIGLKIPKIDNEHIGLNIFIGTIEYVHVKVPIYKLES
jgi:hypothetical protein